MANVMLSDVIIPTVYLTYGFDNSPEKSEFVQSGVAVTDAAMQGAVDGAGIVEHMPFWLDLDPTIEPNYDTDSAADVAVPNKIAAGDMMTRKAFMNQGYSAADLVGEIAGSSPMQRIRDRFDVYWKRQINRRLLAVAMGLLANNVANYGGDMLINHAIADGNNAQPANLFTRATFTSAMFTMGDMFDNITAIMVHSIVAKRMIDNDDITFIQPSEGEVAIPTFLGRRVIVDDTTPVTAGGTSGFVYTSILFGRGAFGYAQGRAAVPVEVYRRPDQGNGGGVETLWERKKMIIHPMGYTFTGVTVTGQSPTLANLRLATNWSRVIERKNVPLAYIQTNG